MIHEETQAILENIARLIHDFRNDNKEESWFDRLESIEKFLINIEDYSHD